MSVLREWIARVAGLFSANSRGIDDELRFHRAMAEERLRAAGHSRSEARRLAAIELGGSVQIAEAYRDQRRIPFADALLQDLRYGGRMLRRTPGFTIAAVLTLAIGIGANTAIFTLVDAVLLRPLPYPQPDRLTIVGDPDESGVPSTVGFTTVMDWRARSRSFEHLVVMRSWQPTLVVNGEAERLPAVRVSWNYFEMMGVRPQIGRSFTADDDRPDHWRVLMLGDALWRRRFNADPAVVGRTVVMNDREYRVIGVLPPTFEPLDAARFYAPAEVWAPVGYDRASPDACRSCRHLHAFGRLNPGVSAAQATTELNVIREQLRREYPNEYEAGAIAVMPLRDAITGQVRRALQVLLAGVGFVLLIACGNVANLLIARSLVRKRELVLRAILGAGRGRIVRQLLTESLMLSGCGAIVGVALAVVAVRGVASLAPVSLPRMEHAAIDARVLGFTAVITLMTALLFGLLPAWRSGRFGVQPALALDSRGSVGGSSRARSVLVMADLALALVLLASAGLMLRTVSELTRTDPGFDPSRVLSVQFSLVGKAYTTDQAVVAFQERLLERVRALPGVQSAALAGQIPFGGNFDCRGFHARDRMKANTVDDPCIQQYGTTPDYLRVMGIPLRAGRFYDHTDTAESEPVLVISESTARTVWGSDDPIGSHVRLGESTKGVWRRVIGVVADTHHSDLTTPPVAAMYVPEAQITDSYLVLVLKAETSNVAPLVEPARAILRELDPSVPTYAVAPLESLVAEAAAQQVFVTRLLTGFAIVAVLLAAVGLYGLVSYAVSQRTRELGVRIALGATSADVVRLVLSNGSVLVIAGIGAGLAAALAANRYLASMVFGVSATDPLTYGAAVVVLSGVALAAHLAPMRRALRIDPAVALRQE